MTILHYFFILLLPSFGKIGNIGFLKLNKTNLLKLIFTSPKCDATTKAYYYKGMKLK